MPRQIDIVRVRVAAGILRDIDGRVLIAERNGDGELPGLWEFPGGKIEDGEETSSALRRELGEELGILVLDETLFMSLVHDYPGRPVSIDFYLIHAWANTPEGRNGQALKWVTPDTIAEELFLPADKPVIDALRDL